MEGKRAGCRNSKGCQHRTSVSPTDDLSQDQHIEGLPLETRGGILVDYNFPADGEYVLRPKLWRNIVRQVRGLELPTQFEISIDGARVHLAQFGGEEDEAFSFNAHVVAGLAFEKRMEIRLPIKAGPHTWVLPFCKKVLPSPSDSCSQWGMKKPIPVTNTGIPELAEADIVGPYNPTHPRTHLAGARSSPAIRRTTISDGGACARQILTPLGALGLPASP